MTLKVAVAGTGYFSQFHFDAWRRLPEVESVAACGLDPSGPGGDRGRFAVPRQFADAASMLDTVRPDCSTSHAACARICALLEAAAARKIDVICQKPLGGDLATARAMVERAKAPASRSSCTRTFASCPGIARPGAARGRARSARCYNLGFRLRPGDGQGPRAYLDRQPYFQDMPRFLIHETAIHLIDMFRFLQGEVGDVFAHLRRLNPAIQGEDAGTYCSTSPAGRRAVRRQPPGRFCRPRNPRLTMGEMWLEGEAASCASMATAPVR